MTKKLQLQRPIQLILVVGLLLGMTGLVQTSLAQDDFCGDTYTVQPNDNLTRIALQCNTTVLALLDTNPQITDPNLLFVGMQLTIPDEDVVTPDPEEGVIPETGEDELLYNVQRGDTLSGIAVRFGTTVEDLLERNPQIGEARLIHPGDQLAVPADVVDFIPEVGEDEQIYTVQRGDTFTGIAVRFGTTPENLLARNPHVIDPALIYSGQQIVVPTEPVDFIPDTGEGEALYTVERGDTLRGIAVRYGTTVRDLVNRNPHILDPALIYPGQQIIVPSEPVDTIPDTGAGEALYTVQRGETLSQIAVARGTTVQDLMERNPHVVDPNLIYPGLQIVVPVEEPAPTPAPPTPTPVPPTPTPTQIPPPDFSIPDTGVGERLYTVQSGDTMAEIAASFNTTVRDLLNRNPHIQDARLIFPGQRLAVPAPPDEVIIDPDIVIPDTGAITFRDEFHPPRTWFVTDEDNFTIDYINGTYRIINDFTNAYVSSIRTFDHEDVHVETHARYRSGPQTTYFGPVCRWQDVNNYYAFTINAQGSFGIVRIVDGEVTFLARGTQDQNDNRVNVGQLTNRIGGSCVGDVLTLFVNGHALLQVQDDTFGDGNVGVMSLTQTSPGTEVHFDIFTIRR
jgi:LysM repeat protein